MKIPRNRVFFTDHAVRRWCERISPTATWAEAENEIRRAIRRAKVIGIDERRLLVSRSTAEGGAIFARPKTPCWFSGRTKPGNSF